MTLGVARAVRLAPARVCQDCGSYPCRCAAEPDRGVPDFALRIEPCVCGGPPIAAGGAASKVREAVVAHGQTPEHRAWVDRLEAWRCE